MITIFCIVKAFIVFLFARKYKDRAIAIHFYRERFEAAADVEDEGQRRVFLRALEDGVSRRFVPRADSEDQGMCHLAVVKIEKVRRGIIGLSTARYSGLDAR